jgi:hypothetical protein
MKLFFGLLLCALSQSTAPNSSDTSAWQIFHAQQATIREHGTEALTREQVRSKVDLCAKSEAGGNAAIEICLGTEGNTTEQNYLAYIRSIGGLLRLRAPRDSISAGKNSETPRRLPFDAAEDSWRMYRGQICTSMATQWQEGTQAPIASADWPPDRDLEPHERVSSAPLGPLALVLMLHAVRRQRKRPPSGGLFAETREPYWVMPWVVAWPP